MSFQSALAQMLQSNPPVGAPPQFATLTDPRANPGMLRAPTVDIWHRPVVHNVGNDPMQQNINLYNAGLMAENPHMNPRGLVEPGSVSTVHSAQFTITNPLDAARYGVPVGSTVIVPTVVWNDPANQAQGGRLILPSEAYQNFAKLGQYLGIFGTPQAASDWERRMHAQQVWQYDRPDYNQGER